MDTDKHSLIAFVAVLISIVLLTGIGAAFMLSARPISFSAAHPSQN